MVHLSSEFLNNNKHFNSHYQFRTYTSAFFALSIYLKVHFFVFIKTTNNFSALEHTFSFQLMKFRVHYVRKTLSKKRKMHLFYLSRHLRRWIGMVYLYEVETFSCVIWFSHFLYYYALFLSNNMTFRSLLIKYELEMVGQERAPLLFFRKNVLRTAHSKTKKASLWCVRTTIFRKLLQTINDYD